MDSLEVRFKFYLETEFRKIAPTESAYNFRKETLEKLMSVAEDYKGKGVIDENTLYQLAINSLGNLEQSIKIFEDDRTGKGASLAKKIVLGFLSFYLVCVIIYLIVSLITSAWNLTWLMFTNGTTLSVCILCGYNIHKAISSKNISSLRLNSYMIIALIFVSLYLDILMLVPSFAYSWTILLYMVIFMLLVDTVICFMYNHKLTWLITMGFVQTTATLIYVILGVMNVINWSPFWLIPVVAAICNFIAGMVLILLKKKGKEKKIDTRDDTFYTKW